MAFIGVALAIAFGLALLISAGAGGYFGLSEDQTGQIVPLLLILVLIASGAFGRRMRFGHMAGGVLAWAGIFVIAIGAYTFRADIGQLAGRVFAELSPGAAVVDPTSGSARFRRSLSGTFRVNAEVNGRPVHFIFDTGATAVVLSQTDAANAGLDVANLSYTTMVQTANGRGMAASVVLDRISIGAIERTRIPAFVAARDALETSLLGLTFLDTLSGFSVNQDSLELRD